MSIENYFLIQETLLENIKTDLEHRCSKLDINIWGKNLNQNKEEYKLIIMEIDIMIFEQFHTCSKLDDIIEFIMDDKLCFVYYLNQNSSNQFVILNLFEEFKNINYNFIKDLFPDKTIKFSFQTHDDQKDYIIISFDVLFKKNKSMITLAIPLDYYIKDKDLLDEDLLDENRKKITEKLTLEEVVTLVDSINSISLKSL